MKAWDVIGYTADADIWCPECAIEAYGTDLDNRRDSEGNDVHPIFASDEFSGEYVCNRCNQPLMEA